MPQQERAQVTREAIMLAAAVEFDQVGYTAAALSAILRRSGVTKGAFYFHFASKRAVADAIAERQRTAWPAMRARWLAAEPDPLRCLIGQVREGVRRLTDDPILRAGVRLCSDSEGYVADGIPPYRMWEQAVTAELISADRAGLLRPGVSPESAARVVMSAAVGARVVTAAGVVPGDVDLVTRAEEVWDLMLPMIANPEWLAGWRRTDAGSGRTPP